MTPTIASALESLTVLVIILTAFVVFCGAVKLVLWMFPPVKADDKNNYDDDYEDH